MHPISSNKRLLAVVAHPDDETFGMGGTLALYSQRGVEVHLICATRGEAGEVEQGKLAGFASIGDLREHELLCAAQTLGIHRVHFLDYRDSGMQGSADNLHPQALVNAPMEQVAEKIGYLLQLIKPQVVLTFDPMGGYLHPDHVFIHRVTSCAFTSAVKPQKKMHKSSFYAPQKLYYHIFPRRFMRWAVKIMPIFGQDARHFGKNKDIDLTAVLATDFPIHARINYREVAAVRERAVACHASQGGDRKSGYIVSWLMRQFSSTESFMRASPLPSDDHIERDLFEGVLKD